MRCMCVRSELSITRFRRGRDGRPARRLLLYIVRVVDACRGWGWGRMFVIAFLLSAAAGPAASARLWHSVSCRRLHIRVTAAVVRIHPGTGAHLSANQKHARLSHARKQTSRRTARWRLRHAVLPDNYRLSIPMQFCMYVYIYLVVRTGSFRICT